MASSDADELAGVPERRLAHDGHRYTRAEFQEYYPDTWEREWANAADRDAAQLPAMLPNVRLMPEQVVAIQQEEAARGPPRSLHRLARDALNTISNNPTRDTVNLDGVFPWVQYVAAHRQSAEIIGPGITHAHAVFWPGTNDLNRGGAPRLDFCFYRTDGSVCRLHPGRTRKQDAQIVFEDAQNAFEHAQLD